MYEVAVVSC